MTTRSASDLATIAKYFRGINKEDFVALPPPDAGRFTQSAGYEDVAEEFRRRGLDPSSGSSVFWYWQSHAFDQSGALIAGLMLNWGGSAERVSAELEGLRELYDIGRRDPKDSVPFVLRVREEGLPAVADVSAVKRALAQMYGKRELSAAQNEWLKAVVLQSTKPSLVIQAFSTIAGADAPTTALSEVVEFVLTDWTHLVRGEGLDRSDYHMRRLIEALFACNHSSAIDIYAQCLKGKSNAHHACVAGLLKSPNHDPETARETAVRLHTALVTARRISAGMMATVSGSISERSGENEEAVALRFANDETVPTAIRTVASERAKFCAELRKRFEKR
jgi:hypothetical protein